LEVGEIIMTIDKAIETAFVTLVDDIMLSELSEIPYNVVSFVARSNPPRQYVKYPAIKIMATPYEPFGPGCGNAIGTVSVTIAVKTSLDSDPDRQILEQIWDELEENIGESDIGMLVESPWLVCGYDNATGDVGIDVDEEEKTQEKNKVVRVAVARITTTSTT